MSASSPGRRRLVKAYGVRPGVVDWSGGVFASCMPRVQLYVNACNGWQKSSGYVDDEMGEFRRRDVVDCLYPSFVSRFSPVFEMMLCTFSGERRCHAHDRDRTTSAGESEAVAAIVWSVSGRCLEPTERVR